MNDAIKELLRHNYLLYQKSDGMADIGRRQNNYDFCGEVNYIDTQLRKFNNEVRLINLKEKNPKIEYSLGGGDPANFKPFPPALKEIKKETKANLFQYPFACGNEERRKMILEYLSEEGFINNHPYDEQKVIKNGLTLDNMIFTVSTTHAYSIILDVIMRPYDVIIIPVPNYALFFFQPERINANVETIDLEESDNWCINPQKLNNRIIEINKNLEIKYKDKLTYTPKVKCILNCNPHNPIGKVMGNNEYDILEEIGKICLKNGVFIIDDMVYRDLTFDTNNIALPIATIPDMFSNTITLFGLSKSYGLAAVRAGLVIADEFVIRGIRNKLFQTMDSPPTIGEAALAGAYNSTTYRKKHYKKYFSKNIKEYKYRFYIVKAMIEGINSISDESIKNKIKYEIKKYIKNKKIAKDILDNGIPFICFPNKIEPESGFFTVLDFSNLKGKKFGNLEISDEITLVEYFYKYFRVKFFIGGSIGWPNKEQLIIRVTYSIDRKDIIKVFEQIYKAIKELE